MTPHTRTLLLLLLALVPAFGGAVSFQATENLPELSFDQRVWLEDKGSCVWVFR